jgi:hypothetical protein
MGIRVYYHRLSNSRFSRTRDHVTLHTLDLSTRASGQVERASLTLRGKTVRATLTTEDPHALVEREADVYYGTGDTAHNVFASMDDNMLNCYKKPVIFMSIMGWLVYALILEPCDGSGDDVKRYKRIGMCHLNRWTYGPYQRNETDDEHLITII